MNPPRDIYQKAAHAISQIEVEMKRIGYWSVQPLPPEAYHFQRAFAADTMSFAQWLQFILIPRVRQIIEERGQFPTNSMVGAMATREFDGDERANDLVRILSEFDTLFTK